MLPDIPMARPHWHRVGGVHSSMLLTLSLYMLKMVTLVKVLGLSQPNNSAALSDLNPLNYLKYNEESFLLLRLTHYFHVLRFKYHRGGILNFTAKQLIIIVAILLVVTAGIMLEAFKLYP